MAHEYYMLETLNIADIASESPFVISEPFGRDEPYSLESALQPSGDLRPNSTGAF